MNNSSEEERGMSNEQFEKEEKQEKQEEKEEKERDEKARNDPLSAVIWAAILIWAGLVFLADNLGIISRLGNLDAWGFVFIGAGVLVLLEAVVRVMVPTYSRPVTGTIIFGAILLAIGLGSLIGEGIAWPLVLIVVGVAMLLGSLLRRR
jgi:hypothetical protein